MLTRVGDANEALKQRLEKSEGRRRRGFVGLERWMKFAAFGRSAAILFRFMEQLASVGKK